MKVNIHLCCRTYILPRCCRQSTFSTSMRGIPRIAWLMESNDPFVSFLTLMRFSVGESGEPVRADPFCRLHHHITETQRLPSLAMKESTFSALGYLNPHTETPVPAINMGHFLWHDKNVYTVKCSWMEPHSVMWLWQSPVFTVCGSFSRLIKNAKKRIYFCLHC